MWEIDAVREYPRGMEFSLRGIFCWWCFAQCYASMDYICGLRPFAVLFNQLRVQKMNLHSLPEELEIVLMGLERRMHI